MDWPPDSDPFIAPNNLDLFDDDFELRDNSQEWKVIQNLGSNATDDAAAVPLSDPESWKRWTEALGFVYRDFRIEDLPQNGFSILFVPRAKDVKLANGPQPSAYTDIPLAGDSLGTWWEVVRAFHLPGHFPKLVARKQTSVTSISRTHQLSDPPGRIWMHTAVANPNFDENSFAMAGTHFEQKHLTLAVMFSCSDEQIDRIQGLVNTWKEAIGHPLLMLGIYAELQLDRLVAIVDKRYRKYEKLMRKVEAQAAKDSKERFSWKMIKKVRLTRETSKKVEEEVETTRLQLSKAYSSALERFKDHKEDYVGIEETTNLFSERFVDIATRFDGLGARCRIIVEGISFTTDIIRSELSRQEAQTSTENSKFATGISLVAMVYLPLTTMATIFAMPIFQWSNDWRDWRYRPVDSGNASSSGPGSSASNGAPPVVSGYIWVYISISIGLTIATFLGFRFYMKIRNRDKDTSLLLSILNILSFGFVR
ncbi:hypothetical protein F5Y11DRAFT_339808 [Daldinia sp. FL1419]|nr:hypothetical protein F5Y11DRAFT_339808 [Daldinia sp. FL1419]